MSSDTAPIRLPLVEPARGGTLDAGPWLVFMGEGYDAEVCVDGGLYEWHARGYNLDVRGASGSDRQALTDIARVIASANLPVPRITELDQARLIRRAEQSAAEACKIIRQHLRKRTGRAWSVTRGKGKRSEEITIHVPPSLRRRGAMTPTEAGILEALTGEAVSSLVAGIRVDAATARLTTIVRMLAGTVIRTEDLSCG